MIKIITVLIFAIFIFTGCDDKNKPEMQNNIKTSYFYDSAVSGLQYTCDSTNETNITDANGKFTYKLTCDQIVFRVGKITIGTIDTKNIKEQVFPADLANVDRNNTHDPKIINILRILQSLDDDSNPSNGIVITQAVRDNLKNTLLRDLRDDTLDTTILENIVNIADPTKNLVDVNSSIAHYEVTIRDKVDNSIDTVAPSSPTLKEPFDAIGLTQTDHNITIQGEPTAKIFIQYDNNGWIDTNKTINNTGEANLTLSFLDLTQVDFTTSFMLQDEKENNSSILKLNITRKDITPPQINIPTNKWNNTNQSYLFSIFEKEHFVQNLNATDNSDTNITYSIVNKSEDSRSSDYILFQIDNNGTISFIDQPNYDKNIGKVYNVVVRSTDTSQNKTDTYIQVVLKNLLDNPPMLTKDENSTYSTTLSEYNLSNGSFVYDLNNTIVWDFNIAPDNDPAFAEIKFYLEDNTDKFDLNETTGKLTIKDISDDLFDFEKNPNYLHLKFRVENNNTTIEGNTTYAYLDINMSNVIDTNPYMLPLDNRTIEEHSTPTIYSINTVQKDLNNSDTNPTMSFSISNGNDGSFTIDSSSGIIKVDSSKLDFETTPSYTLTIRATNTWYDNTTHYTEQNMTVNITNVIDMEPTISITDMNSSIPESTDSGIVVGHIDVNGTYSDQNNTNEGYFLYPSGIPFSIDTNGTITTKRSLLNDYLETTDNNSITDINFTITAKNQWWDGVIHESNPINADINITNVIDNPPLIVTPTSSLSFDENDSTPIDTTIYQIEINGTIYDENNATSYYLVNNTDQFDINSSTGEITLKKLFDWESNTSYDLQFVASNIYWDGSEHNSSIESVHIDIKNIIEKPPAIILPSTLKVHENISNNILLGVIKADSLASVDENNITSITISNGNDGNFTLGNLQKSAYSNLYYTELSTSDNTNLDYESNNSYTLEINATNSYGSTIQDLNISIIDDVDTDLPLVIIAMQFTDINITEEVADTKNKVFLSGNTDHSINKYLINISKNKFQYIKASETYEDVGTKNDGYIKVDINDSHPKNDVDKLKEYIEDALTLADDDINISTYDTNNNGILDANELQILFIVAGGEITYGDDNQSIKATVDKFDSTDIITMDDINLTVGAGNFAVAGEQQNDHFATIGLIAKQLLNTTFNFPFSSGDDIKYNYFDIMGEGYNGADANETNGSRPVYSSCYNTASQGWISQYKIYDKEIYGLDHNITFNSVNIQNGYYDCMRIDTSDNNIYYLIENRNSNTDDNDIFYDNGLYNLNGSTFNGGLVIWKIDTSTTPPKINMVDVDNSSDNVFRPANSNNDISISDFNFVDPPNTIDSDEAKKTYNIGIQLQ